MLPISCAWPAAPPLTEAESSHCAEPVTRKRRGSACEAYKHVWVCLRSFGHGRRQLRIGRGAAEQKVLELETEVSDLERRRSSHRRTPRLHAGVETPAASALNPHMALTHFSKAWMTTGAYGVRPGGRFGSCASPPIFLAVSVTVKNSLSLSARTASNWFVP